jgi:1-acyl-sn-glycerol-3-phosphate acyltransferase
LTETGAAATAPVEESSIAQRSPLGGRLLYGWSLSVAAMLLLILGPPSIFVSWAAGHREWLYPWALFGGRTWLRLSGMRVRVTGMENVDPRRTYVFISNHRSYLDTAALFCYTGKRIGIIAKRELLKVPILGYAMGYVNVMAIDRQSSDSARRTMQAATERMRSGVSFGVFAEGTRALPGELLPFKKGAFYMAVEAGVPIIPVAMKNTDILMGKRTRQARRGIIDMVLLPAVETAGYATDEDVVRLVDRVHGEIAEELRVPGHFSRCRAQAD